MTEMMPPSTPNQSPQKRRSLFLVGLAVGFLLLATVSCTAGLYAVGIDANRLAELRGASSAWTPPPTPFSLATLEPADDDLTAVDGLYAPGDRPRNVTASLVNIRSSPGYLGKPPSDVIAQVTPGQEVEILDGPQSADGLIWWHVRLLPPTGVADGWIAEATASGVQILGQ